MTTLTKKTRERKSCSKGKGALTPQPSAPVVFRDDPFVISTEEASELIAAVKQSRPLSPELRALVIERARRFVLQ